MCIRDSNGKGIYVTLFEDAPKLCVLDIGKHTVCRLFGLFLFVFIDSWRTFGGIIFGNRLGRLCIDPLKIQANFIAECLKVLERRGHYVGKLGMGVEQRW